MRKRESDSTHHQLKQIGQTLNLREHHVCNTGKVFSTPVDLEAHIGKDGRRYLVDFGFASFSSRNNHGMPMISQINRRLYPPQDPNSFFVGKNRHLYQLFRPEFVVGYHTPLCSDGFSSFIQHKQRLHDNHMQEEDQINHDVCQIIHHETIKNST